MKSLQEHLSESLSEAREIVIAEKTIKGLTIIVKADKKSKWYLDGDNPVQVDEDYLLKQIHNERTSPKGKKKGTFEMKLKAISTSTFNKNNAADNAWIKREAAKVSAKDKGGLYGVLGGAREQGKL